MRKTISRLLSFNASRVRLLKENEAFAASIPAGHRVLDAGAGTSPYKELFDHTDYESADFQQVDKAYGAVTYVCDLAAIPVEDHRFDAIVFNQVMEHLPEPEKVLLELARVLKPGGRMIYTGPLFYEEHEVPYDFYRYTQYGLKHLFEKAGFQIKRLDWMEGYFGTMGYQLGRAARLLPSSPKKLGGGLFGWTLSPLLFLTRAWFLILSPLFQRIEMQIKHTSSGYPKNYVAILIRSQP